jgi:hypothetical protein
LRVNALTVVLVWTRRLFYRNPVLFVPPLQQPLDISSIESSGLRLHKFAQNNCRNIYLPLPLYVSSNEDLGSYGFAYNMSNYAERLVFFHRRANRWMQQTQNKPAVWQQAELCSWSGFVRHRIAKFSRKNAPFPCVFLLVCPSFPPSLVWSVLIPLPFGSDASYYFPPLLVHCPEYPYSVLSAQCVLIHSFPFCFSSWGIFVSSLFS